MRVFNTNLFFFLVKKTFGRIHGFSTNVEQYSTDYDSQGRHRELRSKLAKELYKYCKDRIDGPDKKHKHFHYPTQSKRNRIPNS